MESKVKELRYAIVQSIPVMLGYLFLGFAFGLMLNDAGYGFWVGLFISLFVYAGSMQFVLVTFADGGSKSVVYTDHDVVCQWQTHILRTFFCRKFQKNGYNISLYDLFPYG